MLTKFYSVLVRVFFVLILLSLMPVPAAEINRSALQKKISDTDVKLVKTTEKLNKTQASMLKVSEFSSMARQWFKKVAAKKAQIKALQDELKKQNYESGKQKVGAKISSAKRELNSINNFNGALVKSYSGNRLDTVEDLRKAYLDTSLKELKKLNDDYKKASTELKSLNNERDQYLSKLSTGVYTKLKRLQGELKSSESDLEFYNLFVKSANLWMHHPGLSEPEFIPGIQVMIDLRKEYLQELKATGKIYNQNELNRKIAEAKWTSDQAKKYFVTEYVDPLEKKITELKQQIKGLEKLLTRATPEYKLEGCWLLTLGKSTSTINVSKRNSVYRGALTINKLKHFENGEQFFKVKRMDKKVDMYEGVEEAYTRKGEPKTSPLQIIIHSNGNYLTYESGFKVNIRGKRIQGSKAGFRTSMHRCEKQ
ncbi:MAG: hypothetical protein HKP55_04340 [Gammaproteobacteria bacterium]|nr:hypothetical protein [Gammaproteobacteria bacterium]